MLFTYVFGGVLSLKLPVTSCTGFLGKINGFKAACGDEYSACWLGLSILLWSLSLVSHPCSISALTALLEAELEPLFRAPSTCHLSCMEAFLHLSLAGFTVDSRSYEGSLPSCPLSGYSLSMATP